MALHLSVFHHELVAALNIQYGASLVDCTAGFGGHTSQLLEAGGDKTRVFAFDKDPVAISYLKEKFAENIRLGQLTLINAAFSKLESSIEGSVDGIIADLGVSSPQLDQLERGFSFRFDAPLDMRMNQSEPIPNARDLVNSLEKYELVDIFKRYGEEPKAVFIADAIIKRRQTKAIETTLDLADIVSNAIHYKQKSRTHPATKVFQALRIAVNNELKEVEELCEQSYRCLKVGGFFAIISFHSLEDRIIKQKFKALASPGPNNRELRDLPFIPEDLEEKKQALVQIIKPFPLLPSQEEVANNPRARSAKLRVFKKLK